MRCHQALLVLVIIISLVQRVTSVAAKKPAAAKPSSSKATAGRRKQGLSTSKANLGDATGRKKGGTTKRKSTASSGVGGRPKEKKTKIRKDAYAEDEGAYQEDTWEPNVAEDEWPEEYYDDGDKDGDTSYDDGYSYDRGSSRSRRSRPENSRARGGGRQSGRIPVLSLDTIASKVKGGVETAKSTMELAKRSATSASKLLQREVKVYTSGNWESALLKATWPDEQPPDDKLVTKLVASVKRFELDADFTKNSAEHRILLHKLWLKMAESDCRTKVKALFLLHSILLGLTPERYKMLKRFLKKMGREQCRKTNSLYFDLDVLCRSDGGAVARSLGGFVKRYGTYVLKRAASFNQNFEEVKAVMDPAGRVDVADLITVFVKCKRTLDLALNCMPTAGEEQEVTIMCLKNIAEDVTQLFTLYHQLLEWVIKHSDPTSADSLFHGADPAIVADCLGQFKDFYSSNYDRACLFLAETEELLAVYGFESDTEGDDDDEDGDGGYYDEDEEEENGYRSGRARRGGGGRAGRGGGSGKETKKIMALPEALNFDSLGPT